MTLHTTSHPLADQTVKVIFKGEGHFQIPGSKDTPLDYTIEDWWDHLTGVSWAYSQGNPAAIIYAIRAGQNGLPWDDEVVYGKIDGMGHLVHTSELLDALKPEEVISTGVEVENG